MSDIIEMKTAREIATEIRSKGMRCNCDLDNWEPDRSTGHSWVCNIHKHAIAQYNQQKTGRYEVQA